MIAFFLTALTAQAAPNTYCVGGYNNCARQSSKHPKWHHHTNVVGPGGKCLACFDEHDNSCQTDFIRTHSGWRGRSIFHNCNAPNAPILEHKIAGREVSRPPPRPRPVPTQPDPSTRPKPKPVPKTVSLTPNILRITPGPYAAGDSVTVYGSVKGPSGNAGVTSGQVIVTAGGKTSTFSARSKPDGTVAIPITLPPNASSVSVVFVPTMAKLGPYERLTASRSGARTLRVDTCPYKVSVAKPAKGASVQVGAPLQLEPRVTSTSQGGTPSKLALTWTIVPPDGKTVTLQSNAQGKATWNVPAGLSDQTVSISVGGKADGQLACALGERILPISKLGLGWNTSAMPQKCTVDRECKGEGKLMLPDDPAARAALEAALAKPGTKVIVVSAGVRTEMPVSPNHTYSFSTTQRTPGTAWFSLEIETADGGTLSVNPHSAPILPGLTLDLPPVIDFGTVAVGTAWHEVCEELDYSKSTSWEDHGWRLEVQGADDCVGDPVLKYANAWGQPTKASLSSVVETDPHHELRPIHDICLSTWGCSGETAPEVFLVVTPLDPKFADQQKKVRLKWVVEGRSWIICWGWMLVPVVLAMLLAFIVYGFIRPLRFPPHAAIRIASKPGDLKRNAAITLRDLSGSGSGWYRDAKLGLHGSGEVNKHVKTAAVILRAGRRDVLLDPQASLEARDRRTGKYAAVEPLPHAAMPNTIYRCAGVYFQVEV